MRSSTIAVALLAALASSTSQAASVTFHPWTEREMRTSELAGTGFASGKVYGFYLTTDADILSIGNVRVMTSGQIYQDPQGSDANPPIPPIIIIPPLVRLDTWITTPGSTVILGVPFPGDGTDDSAWGDTSDNGPQQNFQFAQLVILPGSAAWSFSGNVAVAGATGPELFPFSFVIPEPGTLGMSAGFVTLVAARRVRRIRRQRG